MTVSDSIINSYLTGNCSITQLACCHSISTRRVRQILLSNDDTSKLLHKRARTPKKISSRVAYIMYRDHYSLREIADSMNVSPQTVRRRILEFQSQHPELPAVFKVNPNRTRALKKWHLERKGDHRA